MAIERIFVPVDGSVVSTRALEFAIERAKIHCAQITIAFAVNRLAVAAATANPYTFVDPTPLLEALDAEADAVLNAAEAIAQRAGVASKRVKLDGVAAPAILTCLQETRADVVVMGTHGRRGFERLALGSTAEEVIRAARIPVFAVSQRCARALKIGSLTHALVAVDGSPAAGDGLAFARELTRTEHARLTLCTVVEPSGMHWDDLDRSVFLHVEMDEEAKKLLEESRVRAASFGVEGGTMLCRGDAATEIVSSARAAGADCIVLGTHGRAGIPRFVLGSVAEGVLRSSPIPVCTVRHR